MKNYFDVIVIGTGPAGLFSAINIKNKSVLILEKNSKPAKKLLISGAGRCNITNSGDLNHYLTKYSDKKNFVQPSLKEFTNYQLLEYFSKNGLNCYMDKNGKYFPETDDAHDFLNILIDSCNKNRVKINYNSKVIDIKKNDDIFSIETEELIYNAKIVIIGTGGLSYPTTGTTGDGYRFAKKFGHKIIPTRPALTSIKIRDYSYKEIEGISLKKITISKIENNKTISNTGDIVFTRNGFSGPGIIDFSRFLNNDDEILINFSELKGEEIETNILNEMNKNGKVSIKKVLKFTNLPERLLEQFLLNLGIEDDMQISKLSKENRKKIVNEIVAKKLIIDKVNGFNMAMVTAGGVDTKEVNRKSMESKLIENLFFVGEVLDVDGDTGGYNVQFAFSSGYLAAKKINL